MSLEFRVRDYRKEQERAAAVLPPRTPAHDHPLASPSPPPPPPPPPPPRSSSVGSSAGPSHKANSINGRKVDVDDPLGVHMLNERHNEDMNHLYKTTPRRHSYEAVQRSVKEWAVFRKALMQKFTYSSDVHVPVASDIISGNYKDYERSSTVMHLQELDDPEKAVEVEKKFVTQQEYISRLKELKHEIEHAWRNGDRITSLKLSIKVARLLVDTSVFQFYPLLFFFVTDVMDMLGVLVWERIRKKAEYTEDGNLLCTLRDDFVSGDICSDAKETCYNWFCKIGSIRELLPRIYLELAILRCWRFLQDHPSHYLRRLTMMMRGLADPLASAYCHLYMVHCSDMLVRGDKDYLLMSIDDISFSLRRIIADREAKYSNLGGSKRLLITLLEPVIEWIMKCIFRDEQSVHGVLVGFGLKGKVCESSEGTPCLSAVLHYLLKELPGEVISINALEILEFLENSNDTSFDQHLNYRLLGLKLCDNELPLHYANSVMDKVLQVVSQYDGLDEYLMVMDAYMDIVLQCGMDNCLAVVMDCILKRAENRSLTENEMEKLQSILVKIIHHFRFVEDAFSQDYFVPIINLLHGGPRNIVSKHILSKAIRGASIHDPKIIQFIFEVSRVLHGDIDISSFKDDYQQTADLICHFIWMVDFGDEMEHHLEFLVQCRAAFRNLDDLKESFVHSSNFLAMKAIKGMNKFQGFVRACIAFNEVTIPSISPNSSRLNLYLESAEVALSAGLVSHVDGLLDSAITSLDCTLMNMGPHILCDADWILSLLLKLCSILVMVPGNCKEGASHILRSILAILESQSWVTPLLRIKMLCAIVSLSATLSQNRLPYQVNGREITGNNLLFFGENLYYQELESTSNLALRNLVDSIEKGPYTAAQGKIALDACNSLVVSLKASQELSSICSGIIKMAKSRLHPQDKYLQSTIDFLVHRLPGFAGMP